MTLQGTFRFQNPDSTQDMNDRWSFLFGRGIFDGGVVTPVSGQLQVTTSAFKAVGFDGMMVEDSSTATHTVVDGVSNFVVARAKYNTSGSPILSYEVMDTSTFNQDEDKNFLIVFARIDVPALASEVTTTDINLGVRDEVSSLARDSFRGIFATSALLPSAELSVLGDWVIITQGADVPEVHVWNTIAWINATPATSIQTELTNHRNDVFSDEVHLTNNEADAVAGSSGTPSGTNLFVTEADTRLPAQGENDALVGTQGAPSTGNPYVSSAHVIAVPAETEFGSAPAPANRITIASGTAYYTGTDVTGTAHQWFAAYNQAVNTKGVLRNSAAQAITITGIFTDGSMTTELDPSTNGSVDSDGFFNGTDLFGKTDNNIDSGFRLSFGVKDDIGTSATSARIDRGPKTYFVPVQGASPTGAIFGEQDSIQALFQFKFGDKSDVYGRYIPNASFDTNTVWRRDNIFRNAISMEVSKTQLMTGTEDFSTGWTQTNVAVTPNNTFNWRDIKKAAKIAATGASPENSKTAAVITTSTLTRCFSVYVKSGTSTQVTLRLDHAGGGTTPTAIVDYDLVAVTSDASGSPDVPVAHGLDYSSQGWYRCWLSIASVSANTTVVVGMNPDTAAANNYAFFDKSQLELGAYPSAWIDSTPGFRSAPTLGYDADFLPNRGSISMWARRSDLDNTFDSILLWNDNSATTPVGPAFLINTSGNLAFFDFGTGIVQTSTTTAVGDRNWHHYVYDYGLGKIWFDGTLVHNAADAVVEPNVAEPIHIGTAASSVDKKFNGEIAEVLFEAGAASQEEIDGRVANGQKGRLLLVPTLNRPVRHYNVIDTTDGDQYVQDVDPIAVSGIFLNPITNADGTITFASDATMSWVEASDRFELDKTARVTNVTDAASAVTGALQSVGGLGVTLDAWIGVNLHVDGASFTFEGANADRTISFASDASLAWVEASDRFAFNKNVDFAGNITLTGTVDTVDIAALKTDVDGFPDALKNLVTGEINQLENIGATTISAGSWVNVGAMDQDVGTTDSPTFAAVIFAGSGDGLSFSHATSDGLLRSTHHMTFIADDDATGTNATFSWRINAVTRAGAAEIMSLTEAGVLDVQGNITLTGTVDTVDVAALQTDVDGFPDELKNLTAGEIGQLENIGTETISAGSWGNVAAMDQDVATTDSPVFATLNVSGADIEFTGAASNRAIIFETGGANLAWVAASNGWLFDGITGSATLAGLKIDRATTGIDRSLTLFNSVTAAINSASEIAFSANRTTNGETIIGSVKSTITDIGAATADGKMEFSVALNTVLTEVMELTPAVVTVTGDIRPEANNTRSIGTSGLRYNTVWATTFDGTASAALYSDLAEKYTNVDGDQSEGTVVSKTISVNPNYQVEVTKKGCDFRVLGVVSCKPGYVMNSGSTHQAVARVGMIPVRVIGPIVKGDFLVSSHVPGCARAGRMSELEYKFGWADESSSGVGELLINCIL